MLFQFQAEVFMRGLEEYAKRASRDEFRAAVKDLRPTDQGRTVYIPADQSAEAADLLQTVLTHGKPISCGG